jgi:hypothetical protein
MRRPRPVLLTERERRAWRAIEAHLVADPMLGAALGGTSHHRRALRGRTPAFVTAVAVAVLLAVGLLVAAVVLQAGGALLLLLLLPPAVWWFARAMARRQ